MTTEIYRGVVRGGRVVFHDDDEPLVDGTEVIVTPVQAASATGAELIAALQNAPQVPPEWVDELESLIEGRRPPTTVSPIFDFEAPENP